MQLNRFPLFYGSFQYVNTPSEIGFGFHIPCGRSKIRVTNLLNSVTDYRKIEENRFMSW